MTNLRNLVDTSDEVLRGLKKLGTEQFWQTEELPLKKKSLSEEEEFCDNHFKATYKINNEGRFVVKLPIYRDINQLGNTRVLAVSSQMNSLAASVKLTYSASMVDRLTDFCLKVRHEIGVSSIKVMNPPIETRSSLFVAKSESE
ncbi:DUF1758 domain-containing protein [Trichonephila clavipes]|nr:DUF1758 domain-containing protein [Trichonephila clavipes]